MPLPRSRRIPLPAFDAAIARSLPGSQLACRARAGRLALRVSIVVLDRHPCPDDRAAAARRAITDIRERRTRDRLDAIVSAATSTDLAAVFKALRAYGTHLFREGSYDLAADTYRVVIATASADLASAELGHAHYWLGYSLRESGDEPSAADSFAAAESIAAQSHDLALCFNARIALASLHWSGSARIATESFHEGLARAAVLLDDVLLGADQASLPATVARAAHDRGVVAHLAGDDHLALALYARAWPLHLSTYRKYRLLDDIGRSLVGVGLRDIAREAHLAAYLTAPEKHSRWSAGINLLFLAIIEGNRDAFEQYRAELARTSMSSRLLALYLQHVGEGYCFTFDEPELGQHALLRALVLAERHHLPDAWHAADRALLGHSDLSAPARTDVVPPELTPLIHSVRTLTPLSTFLHCALAGGRCDTPLSPTGQLHRRRPSPR
jgi:hypothetical protein